MGQFGYGHIGFISFSHRVAKSRLAQAQTLWKKYIIDFDDYFEKYHFPCFLSTSYIISSSLEE
jgi:hypothetical protein